MDKITIGRINSPRAAQAFCDYMRSHNISVTFELHDGLYHLFITDLSSEDFTCAELRDFLSNPDDPKYLDASWNEGTSNFSAPMRLGSSGALLKGFWQRSGVVTKSLTAISILVTLLTVFGENTTLTRWLTIADPVTWQGSLNEIYSGQIWRLITPIFLHFMVLHILFNMMWLWDLGGAIEHNQSAMFLLFFVLSIGMLSNIIQYLSHGPAFGGMSGVVYGLLGYIWMRSRKPQSGYRLHSTIVVFMLVWLGLGFTGILGPIANAAHLSGLILGIAYGLGWNNYE